MGQSHFVNLLLNSSTHENLQNQLLVEYIMTLTKSDQKDALHVYLIVYVQISLYLWHSLKDITEERTVVLDNIIH